METRRWTNPSQPQTLQIAVFLLYINAVFSVLLSPIGLFTLVPVAGAVGAYGIANDRRWGYHLGVAAATFRIVILLLILALAGIGRVFDLAFLISAMFPIALFCLLLHPQSREHQRIWFT